MTQRLGGGHERLSADDDAGDASPRGFGFTFALVFALYALWPIWRHQRMRGWALAVAVLFCALAVLAPRVLTGASRAWQRLGLLLHHIVNPVVMGALFYAAITPFAYIMRRRQPSWTARYRIDRSADTYWVTRKDASVSMRHQF